MQLPACGGFPPPGPPPASFSWLQRATSFLFATSLLNLFSPIAREDAEGDQAGFCARDLRASL